jgi:hypothetical protein
MRWTHATVGLLTVTVAALSFFAGRWSALPAKDACPEMEGVEPALVNLADGELERRFRAGATVPPSAAERQLAALRAQADAAPPDRRACVHRAALARAVAAQERTRHGTPGLWGLDHPSEEIKARWLAEPLKDAWSREERLDVIAQIEEQSIARLAGASPGDVEHWRRRWYGLALACEGTDEALAHVGAARPADCPRYTPRRPAP